jgi:hypothetical protein
VQTCKTLGKDQLSCLKGGRYMFSTAQFSKIEEPHKTGATN